MQMLPALDQQIVRAYDIRGIFGVNLHPHDAFTIGLAFARYIYALNIDQEVLVAYDGRLSSPVLFAQLVAGLQAGGVRVHSLGLVPTPVLYYATNCRQRLSGAGIMITASHNPPEYNGFKIVIDGLSITAEQLHKMLSYANMPEIALGDMQKQHEEHNILPNYIENLRQIAPPATHLKVIWDAGHGAASIVLPQLLPHLAGQHILLHGTVDGNFPDRHPDPTIPANLTKLRSSILQHDADFGLAFDGDADRLVVMDKQGNILHGDQLLAIFAQDCLQRHLGGTVIVDIKTSQTIIDYITSLGGKAILWKCGHAFIKEKMRASGALIAGEVSGHMFFAEDYYGFDDALYAACLLLRIMHNNASALSTVLALGTGRCVTSEIRIPCAEGQKFALIANIAQQLHKLNIQFCDLDGLRAQDEDGWWLIRASNTEACLITRFDARDAEALVKQQHFVEKLLWDAHSA